MPGHIGGKGMPAPFKEIAAFDVTELQGLDDIHMPRGIIAEGAALMAELNGAGHSFFLLNGASSGIQAFFLSLNNPEGKVLIPRNAHRSFLSGSVLSGASPVFIPVHPDEETGVAWEVRKKDLEKACRDNNDLEAVFIVSPGYFGHVQKISELLQNVREHFAGPFLVDEAHGGHFLFHDLYPPTALEQGACGAVQGLHKTWPVFNQGACLHLNNKYVSFDQVAAAISLLTTTSPSYPLLASMDYARAYLCQYGSRLLEQGRLLSAEFKEKINALPGFKIATPSQQNPKGHIDSDPLKLLIRLDRLNLNGYQLSRILRETHGINIECGGPGLVLAMMSMFHDKRDWEKLYLALSQISSQYPGKRKIEKTPAPDIPIQALTPRKAYKAKKHVLPLENSVGKIAGEMVTVYPPGIPCLWPGEVIDKSIEEYLNWAKKNGAYVQKFSGPDLDKISIINGAW